MKTLSVNATNEEIIEVVHQWVRLLEAQDYTQAIKFIEQEGDHWTPELLREVIETYANAEPDPDQRVTFHGKPTDSIQLVEVDRWDGERSAGAVGSVWYDLNINGEISDLTATFLVVLDPDGLRLSLEDVHVM